MIKNDPRYCYFIEEATGHWIMEHPKNKKKFLITKDPLKALKFDGDEGKAMATVYLTLEQSAGNLKEFFVTEHEFINP